jgi:hypothetical protein
VAETRCNPAGIDAMSSPLAFSTRCIAFSVEWPPQAFRAGPASVCMLGSRGHTMQTKLHLAGFSFVCRAVVRYFWGWKTLHRTTRTCAPLLILAHFPRSAPVINRPCTAHNHQRHSIYPSIQAGARGCCGPQPSWNLDVHDRDRSTVFPLACSKHFHPTMVAGGWCTAQRM